MLKAWVDGSYEICRGGTAGYGILVVDETGEILLQEGKVVGSGPGFSNNVAEYCAVIRLLEWLPTHYTNAPPKLLVEVYSDSQLLVQQMNLVFKAKKGLYLPYFLKAMGLLNALRGFVVHFNWIAREENKAADFLSRNVL